MMVKLSRAAVLAMLAFRPVTAFAQSPPVDAGVPVSNTEWNMENEIAQLKSQVDVLAHEVSDLQAHDPQAAGTETFSNDDPFLEEPIATGG